MRNGEGGSRKGRQEEGGAKGGWGNCCLIIGYAVFIIFVFESNELGAVMKKESVICRKM